MTRRIGLVIEYDGTGYAGFQRQANAPSIQEELENAIESLTTVRATVRGAGRTDAGVHALAQVVAFDTESVLPTERVVAGLNHYLGEQIAVRAAYDVPLSFDPRRHARARVYRYRLLEGHTPSPLRRGVTHRVARGLDTEAMHLAATGLVGEHDLRAFSGPQPSGKSFVRRMTRATVSRDKDEVVVELEGNAFSPPAGAADGRSTGGCGAWQTDGERVRADDRKRSAGRSGDGSPCTRPDTTGSEIRGIPA